MSLTGTHPEDSAGTARERLLRLASAAVATSYSAAPHEVRLRVQDLIVDTLAVTAWGSRRHELAALRQICAGEGSGSSTVLGTSFAGPAALACCLNGSAAAADQLQDGHRMARGHPASHVVLAAFALAEARDATTEAMLSAVLTGYEVGTRVGMAMGGTPPGVHDIGTWGAVAAAVATTHLLLPGDDAAMVRAIELAASNVMLSDAHTIFTGHSGGHAYLGASISHGLWLGQAAAAGLTAAPGSLERFLGPHAAAQWSGLPLEDPAGWHEYEILRGYIKLHPACAHLHGVLDALADIIRGAPGLVADQVEAVHVRTYAAASAFGRPAENELEARFSIPTSVALTLRHGHFDEDVLTDEEVRSRQTRDLGERVEVTQAEDLEAGYPAGRPTTVEVVLRDGQRIDAHSQRPKGDADGTASQEAVRAKTARLLEGAFGPKATQVLTALSEWPSRHTPRELGNTFRLAASGPKSNDSPFIGEENTHA